MGWDITHAGYTYKGEKHCDSCILNAVDLVILAEGIDMTGVDFTWGNREPFFNEAGGSPEVEVKINAIAHHFRVDRSEAEWAGDSTVIPVSDSTDARYDNLSDPKWNCSTCGDVRY